jgi:hypothetical protein
MYDLAFRIGDWCRDMPQRWLAGGADHDGLCGWNALRIPVARLVGGDLWLRQFSAVTGAVSQPVSSPDMQ